MTRRAHAGAVIAVALAAAACTTDEESLGSGAFPNVEALRGCWVMKKEPGGEVLGFLRLLPPAQGAATYDGQVHLVSGDSMKAGPRFSFARDGSSATRFSDEETDAFASGRYLSVAPTTASPDMAGPAPPLVLEFVHRGAPASILSVRHSRGPEGDESILIRTRSALIDAATPPITTDFEGERDGCD